MADVTGRISSLPGSFHVLPEGAMCDIHPDVAAVARVQGETDSFGSEMNDMCQACLDEYRAYMNSAEARTGRCDWCKRDALDLRDTRDYEEGMCGPVYRVCDACRKKANDEAAAELDNYESWEDFYDPHDYEPQTYEEIEEEYWQMEAERADREAADLAHREALFDRELYRNEWRDKK
jgi:hypothetical protein